MNRNTSRLAALLLSLLVLAGVMALRAADPAILSALRGSGFDSLQILWPRQMEAGQPVRIVDIDEASLQSLGQWPWPRTTLAKLVNELTDLGAAVIAFDIVFPEPDRMSPRLVMRGVASVNQQDLADNDAIFAQAIRGRPVVMAFAAAGTGNIESLPVKAGFAQTGADASGAPPRLSGLTANIDILNQAASGLGAINIDLARDQGVARKVPLLLSAGERMLPALVPEALRVAQGADTFLLHASDETENAIESLVIGDIEVPLAEDGSFHVYYRPNATSSYVSAARILAGTDRDALRPLIEGHIVFIGTSAVGLHDTRTTALGEAVPGVSIHGQITEQILSGTFLTRPEWVVGGEFIYAGLAGLLLACLAMLVKPGRTVAAYLALVGTTLLAVVWAFRSKGLLLDATFPLLALTMAFLSAIALRLLVADREGRRLRGAFKQYVAPAILAEIEKNPAALKLGGEMRDVSVMFVDIENFTPLGEKLPPEDLVRVVNRLLDTCSKAILSEKGTIDKYIGDAVMAFWNAPVALPDHQLHAARAALAVRKAVAALNDEPALAALLARHACPRLAVRAGIASGMACVGNMGSEDRFDYSVLGETVNIASRAESSCKAIGHDIVIAGKIAEATRSLALVPAGKVPMKGKSALQPIHAVMGGSDLHASQAFRHFRDALAGVTAKLATRKSAKPGLALQGLLDELRVQHPEMQNYLDALQGRIDDFRAS